MSKQIKRPTESQNAKQKPNQKSKPIVIVQIVAISGGSPRNPVAFVLNGFQRSSVTLFGWLMSVNRLVVGDGLPDLVVGTRAVGHPNPRPATRSDRNTRRAREGVFQRCCFGPNVSPHHGFAGQAREQI